MPLQNRVSPFGELFTTPARGTLMGNRGGRLHDAQRKLGMRRWSSKQWICCVLDFNGRALRRDIQHQAVHHGTAGRDVTGLIYQGSRMFSLFFHLACEIRASGSAARLRCRRLG